ncbi:MBOAT family protein [Dokdonella sp.]|uniref:MBOAT family O-acyltransferase n=1 Tax=Dokdonella sp. TaxID=2291710 RepID=UPI001B0C4BBA|nr:MBOAT family protein [Dokdonella sp.]MBO9663682.1 MBOAT family protein [Dokdonella sp.]
MQFDSLSFLVFLAAVLAGYNALRAWPARKNFLLVASCVFYAAWNPPFLLLLLGSATLDWWIAMRIEAAEDARARKAWVTATLLVNLAVLGYFKYWGFVLDTLCALLARVGIVYSPPDLGIVLPIGISFYTFHSLSYCLDVYRRKIQPTRNWRDYALYVAFFPQLVAGPIVRWTQMRQQIETPRSVSDDTFFLGLTLLVIGLFEKIVLADSVFAGSADRVFNTAANVGAADAWVGMLAFSGQIFCDFAGYSTCALGVAAMLGFRLPINFRSPYAAGGFADFWRRWHITLSSWLRDYLYIPLGGNRHGAWLTYRNLMLTMLIGGLWHGAAWTFVAWGGLHGLYLSIERFFRGRIGDAVAANRLLRFAYAGVTLLAVMYAWVWFRAADFGTGWILTRQLVNLPALWSGWHATTTTDRIAVAVFALVVAAQASTRNIDLDEVVARMPALLLGLLLAAMLVLIVLSPGDSHAFIYFQF